MVLYFMPLDNLNNQESTISTEPTVAPTAAEPPLPAAAPETTPPGQAQGEAITPPGQAQGEAITPATPEVTPEIPSPAPTPVQTSEVPVPVPAPEPSVTEPTNPPNISPQPSPYQGGGAVQGGLGVLLQKAKEKIMFRKRAKLEKVVALVQTKGKITNNDVEKLLHLSDATATRYLNELVKQGRLRRVGPAKQPFYQINR